MPALFEVVVIAPDIPTTSRIRIQKDDVHRSWGPPELDGIHVSDGRGSAGYAHQWTGHWEVALGDELPGPTRKDLHLVRVYDQKLVVSIVVDVVGLGRGRCGVFRHRSFQVAGPEHVTLQRSSSCPVQALGSIASQPEEAPLILRIHAPKLQAPRSRQRPGDLPIEYGLWILGAQVSQFPLLPVYGVH